MKDCWRYIAEDRVSAAYGLAADEYLMGTYEHPQGLVPPTLRLYTYRSHCALVGQFQNLAAEIDIEFCRKAEIPTNRRPTGGGAILMGEDQLGMALVTSTKYSGIPDHPREIFALFSGGICRGLETLGIDAAMRGKNDVVVAGRKIAGLGLCRGAKGALLFHASLLVDLDTALMLQVLKIPREKLGDKLRPAVEENITTVRREAGTPIAVTEVRKIVRQGFAAAMGLNFIERPFSLPEKEQIAALEREKFANRDWVFGRSSAPAKSGADLRKTPEGLLRIYVSVVNEVIDGIQITGDFFADRKFVRALERNITGLPAAEALVRPAIRQVYATASSCVTGIAEEDLARSVMAALEQAKQSTGRETPYGCFLAPMGG